MEENQYKNNDVPSSSGFKWKIENICKLNEESRLSPVFTIGPHKWRLLAFRNGCNVDGYLAVYVVAVECKIPRCAKFIVAIVGQTNNTLKHDSEEWTTFTEDEDDWGFGEFIQLKELKDPSNGYIVNDACTIQVELCFDPNSNEVGSLFFPNQPQCYEKMYPYVFIDFVSQELAPIAPMESAQERYPVTSSSLSVDNNSALICAFCRTFEVSEKSGSMLHIANGKEVEEDEVSGPNVIHVHRKCMEWAPQVYYVDETVKNLEMEVARGSKLKCKCCGLKGSALGCFISSCKNTYHFPCAFGISGCRWDNEGYLMLCPSHSGMKFPHEKTKKGKNLDKENPSSIIHHLIMKKKTRKKKKKKKMKKKMLHLKIQIVVGMIKEFTTKFESCGL
ncbi:hypothetical protein MKW98_021237 [Papaver atlanticum]|uniref:Uncharacterized protein n=1 Tax=Papaver atlanticum TaxID=357466 RepID=A0AAD4S929_9MAGN|nr:hypothetical protein MKW98_021237 [Papaver atlanticum]